MEIIDNDTTAASAREEEQTEMSRRALLQRAGLVGAAGLVLGPTAVICLTAEPAEAQLFGRPSVAQQKQLGAQSAQQVLQKYREVRDRRAQLFNEVGQRLVAALPGGDRNKFDYSFRVLDSKDVNAFALPGGPMFLFTGLMEKFDTVDALAAVTAHEIAHVQREHWAKSYAKQNERGALLGLGLTLFGAGRTAQTLAGVANSLINLKYSRGDEDDADAQGLNNLVAAGFNPSGMLRLFYTLERLGGGKGIGGEFLSDHPMTSTRINKTKQRILAMRGRRFPAVQPLNYGSLV
jgi:predicted Zn-dependent protease